VTLAIGDAVALVIFVIIGLVNHEHGITLAGLARTALPLLGAWFAVAAIAGTYRRPGIRTLLVTWAVAVPVAVVIRAIILHRRAGESQVTFGIVALIVTLALLLAWRFVAKRFTQPAA